MKIFLIISSISFIFLFYGIIFYFWNRKQSKPIQIPTKIVSTNISPDESSIFRMDSFEPNNKYLEDEFSG
jgi:hypothetical protein